MFFFFFSSRRRHTRWNCDWSSDVCSSDLPDLSLALNRSLGCQLRDTRAPAPTTRPRPTTVALIALDARVPLPRLAARLGAALDTHLSVAVLNGAKIPVPVAGEPAAVYGPLLDRAEADHDMVLLVAGSVLRREPWMEFCLQQADRILAVTGAGPAGTRRLSRAARLRPRRL